MTLLPPSKCVNTAGPPFLDNSSFQDTPYACLSENAFFNKEDDTDRREDYRDRGNSQHPSGPLPLPSHRELCGRGSQLLGSPEAAIFQQRTFSESRGGPTPHLGKTGGPSLPALSNGVEKTQQLPLGLERRLTGLPTAAASASDGAGGLEVPQKAQKSDS